MVTGRRSPNKPRLPGITAGGIAGGLLVLATKLISNNETRASVEIFIPAIASIIAVWYTEVAKLARHHWERWMQKTQRESEIKDAHHEFKLQLQQLSDLAKLSQDDQTKMHLAQTREELIRQHANSYTSEGLLSLNNGSEQHIRTKDNNSKK